MTPRFPALFASVLIVFGLSACHKKSADEAAQDQLLVRDADVPGLSQKITDKGRASDVLQRGVREDGERKGSDEEGRDRDSDRKRDNRSPDVLRSDRQGESDSGSRCDSPRSHDQRACLRALIAVSDVRLDNVYQALIAATAARAGAEGDRHEARASVRRLRAAERQWLDYRDKECRRQTFDVEGKLWARTRAKCLGEFSGRRAEELSRDLDRVRSGR